MADGKASDLKDFTVAVWCGCPSPRGTRLGWGAACPPGEGRLSELVRVGSLQNLRDGD